MEKVITQEEIDALLQGIKYGKVETTSDPQGESKIIPFDLANQDGIIHGRMPTLEALNDFSARILRTSLFLVLRKIVAVTPRSLLLTKYGEFIQTLPVPSCLHLFKMNPLRGNALLAFDPKLDFTFLDIFLGGTGRSKFKVEGRDFTTIKSKLIHKVVNIILTEQEKIWNCIHPISFQYVRSEANPQFASIAPPTDLVLTIPFELEIEQNSGFLTLCIPYSMLEPIKGKLYSEYQTDHFELDQSWMERFLEQLKQTEVDVVVEFCRTRISAQKLLSLNLGDFLPLEKEVSDLLVAKVHEIPKFVGRAGIYGISKALQI
jgi:flagellar motor switch protein FliM